MVGNHPQEFKIEDNGKKEIKFLCSLKTRQNTSLALMVFPMWFMYKNFLPKVTIKVLAYY
jgi:hypothetical protein